MTEDFQSLLQKASAMKTEQLKKLNRDWYTAPDCVKTTWKHFKKDKHHEKNLKEKYELCMELHVKGRTKFKDKHYDEALDLFAEALSPFYYFSTSEDEKDDRMPLVDATTDVEPDRRETVRITLARILFASGRCLQEKNDYPSAKYCFKKAIVFHKKYVKAMYQIAVCNIKEGTTTGLENARDYLKRAKGMGPTNKELQELQILMKSVKKLIREQKEKDRRNFGGFFSRGVVYGDKKEIGEVSDVPKSLEDILKLPPPPQLSWISSLPEWVKDLIRNPITRLLIVIAGSIAFSRFCILFFRLLTMETSGEF